MVVHRPVLHQEIDNYTRIGSMEIQRGRPSRALDAFQAAYKRSMQADVKALQLACAFNLGATCIASGHPERGLAVLRSVTDDHDVENMPDLFFNMAIAYDLMKERGEMVKCLEKAFKGYQLQGNMINMESDIALKLALNYETNKQWNDAAAWHSRCAELLHRQHRPVARLRTMTRQAECAMKASDSLTAKEVLSVVAQVLVQIDDRPSRARIYTEMGLVQMHLGDMKQATTYFQAALPFIDTVKDPSLEASLHQNLGAALNVCSSYEESLLHHRTAISKYGSRGNRAAQGHCFANLGFALSQLSRGVEAREAYLHAQQAAMDTNDKRSQWQCYEALGVLHFNASEYNKSADNFQRALAICGGTEGSEKERETVIAKLKRAIEQQQNAETLRNNPYLKKTAERPLTAGKVVEEEEEMLSESESDESVEEPILEPEVKDDPEIRNAMSRIGGLASGQHKWDKVGADSTDNKANKGPFRQRFMGRKPTDEKLFTNPKRNKVLLFDEAELRPIERTKKSRKKQQSQFRRQRRTLTDGDDGSLTSVTTATEEDEEDRAEVRKKYREVLDNRKGGIAATASRIADLARQYKAEAAPKRPMTAYGHRLPQDNKEEEEEEEETETEDSSDDSSCSSGESGDSSSEKQNNKRVQNPPVPQFPGTIALEGNVDEGTYEKPIINREQPTRSGDYVDFFGGHSLDDTYDKIGPSNLHGTTKSEANDPAYAQVQRRDEPFEYENGDNPPLPPRLDEYTRAERERVLYEKHQELMAQRAEESQRREKKVERPKKSSACNLM